MSWKVFFFYYVIINIVSLFIMGIDKWKAKNHRWRIPERVLFLSALLGGSVGSNLGMQLFRHKTKHMQFVIGMPAICIVQTAGIFFLILNVK